MADGLSTSWGNTRPGEQATMKELAIGWHSLANKLPDGRTKASPGRVLG